MPFLKEDLAYHHYNWKQESSTSIFKGNPSRRLFDRFDGNQVLFIINFHGTLSEKISIQEGREMEELISSQLPMEAKSELSVYNWLRSVC